MPTENRSSKTEQMVSVPRDEVERLVKLLAYQAHPYPSPHAEYWQGVLNQPAEQHQGEIVGYRVQRVTPTGNPRLDRPLLTLATPEEWGPAWKADALYTHADSDEVDQLRLEVEKLRFDLTMVDDADIQDDCVRSENRVLRADLETVKSSRDAFGQNAIDLRAQLAERDALFARILGKRDACATSFWFDEINALLSASTDPSPPVCDHQFTDDGEFLLVCTECGHTEDHNPHWRPMETAPTDGTLVRLLVEFEENSTEDDQQAPTIGHNSYKNTGEDEWQFAGWNWQQDCYTSGQGAPVGWLPLLDPPVTTSKP